jgi:hypothetical protein
MPPDPGKLSHLARDFKQAWDRMGSKPARNLGSYKDYSIATTGALLTIKSRNSVLALSLDKQAYQLDQLLPRNLNLLASMVRDPSLSIEWRAKLLQVMILRGATNKVSYGDIELFRDKFSADWSEWEEKQQYQLAARDAVLHGPPGLFDHLSRSRDQLPDKESGRYPATEWMNTMLKEGGLLSDYKVRQEAFEPWLNNLPAETRGQALFHLRDAEGAREVGKVREFTGFEFSAGPVGFGLQWNGASNTHWQVVGQDVLGKVDEHLTNNPEEQEAFYSGYTRADRELADLPSR